MSNPKLEISEEELLNLSSKVGHEKFLKRQKEFVFWIDSFISTSKSKGTFPDTARLLHNMNIEEAALYLNYFYWLWTEEFVKKVLKDSTNGEVKVNHYKIAATIEFVVMKYLPFDDEKNEVLKNLNGDFAFHVALQILFAWNLEKENIPAKVIRDLLTNNTPTKEFILEHKTWLRHHAIAHQYVIFSNMQTMRLFHYWFRDPKDETFSSY
ncbi:MAG: hypothetical protein ABI723_08215 [Bacteroidia bacterium]